MTTAAAQPALRELLRRVPAWALAEAAAADGDEAALHRHAEAASEALRLVGIEVDGATLAGIAESIVNTRLRQEEAAAGWPKPRPIEAPLRPVPAFDADALLPEALRAWILDESERMPCPPEFVAAPALVALGAVIGTRCAIKPKSRDSWLVVPNLWGAVVADPAAKKSPAWAAALQPVDKLIAGAMAAHRAALDEYDAARLVHEAKRAAIEDRLKQAARRAADVAPIVGELRAVAGQAPAKPAPRRFKTNDCTVEKLGELLRENPSGLLVLRDELVGLLASWDREGREGDRAFFLEAWNGDQSFDTDRIGRGHVAIPNLCLSIFGGIQPDKLTAYLEQSANALGNDGLLQRFQMLVYPDPIKWEWRDRAPDRAARERAHKVFEAIADVDFVTLGATPADGLGRFPYFRFDAEAQAIFIEWSGDLHGDRIANEENPLVRQHLAKYDKLFPALALILHLVDCVDRGARGPVSKQVALRAAAWTEFLEAHARRCYGLLADGGLRAAQALAAKIERGALPDGFTARDVRRHQWRYLTTQGAVASAIEWLEDEGWIVAEPTGGAGPGGRPTERYRINPIVLARPRGGRR